MKHFLLLLTFLIVIAGCKDKEETEPKLFPYFYCKVNGQNFAGVPSGPLTGCIPWRINYYPNGFLDIASETLILSGYDCTRSEHVGIGLYGFEPNFDMMFLEDTTMLDTSTAFFSTRSIGDERVRFDSDISGSIKFDRFSDQMGDQDGVVSGTFEFSATNQELDSTIYITEGRFQYIIDYEWY